MSICLYSVTDDGKPDRVRNFQVIVFHTTQARKGARGGGGYSQSYGGGLRPRPCNLCSISALICNFPAIAYFRAERKVDNQCSPRLHIYII